MDPLTQGVFGSLWAQAGSGGKKLRQAAAVGFVAGMAPDLDVLIRSSDDALLFIDYHRHFTHSIPFAPIGGLLVAMALWPLMRRQLGFAQLYLFCFLGYLSHGILDAFTSYGTHLWWPFTDQRVALNWISVIDPLFTLPLLVMLALAVIRRQRLWQGIALAWAALYLGFGGWQHQRAEQQLMVWAQQQGMVLERHVVKPAFANLILWRAVIDDGDRFHALAIRIPPLGETQVYRGDSVLALSSGLVPTETRLARDIERFAFFSEDWLFRYRAIETDGRWFIGDFRYAIDPASTRPLWGIHFDPGAPGEGVQFERLREVDEGERRRYLQRLRGERVE